MSQIEYVAFVVGDKPYCVWGNELHLENRMFLNQVKPDFFSYVAGTIEETVSEKSEQLAALASRQTYYQGLETLFAFVGAALQCPAYVPGWLERAWPNDIRRIVEAIEGGERLRVVPPPPVELTWRSMAERFYSGLNERDRPSFVTFYSSLWSRFAKDYLNRHYQKEYNSIKHGLRVFASGYQIAVAPEGATVPLNNDGGWIVIGESSHGTEYISTWRLSEEEEHSHHRVVRTVRVSWDRTDTIFGLKLLSMSLANVISYLRAFNRADPKTINFVMPSSQETGDEPWKRLENIGVRTFDRTVQLSLEHINPDAVSKEQILAWYDGEEAGQG